MELEEKYEKILIKIYESDNESLAISDLKIIEKAGKSEIQEDIDHLISFELVEFDKTDNAYYLTYEGYEFVESIGQDAESIASENGKRHRNEGKNKYQAVILGLILLFGGYLIWDGVRLKSDLINDIDKQVLDDIKKDLIQIVDSVRLTKEAEERLDFYGFDTLLIRHYTSDNGNKIKLEGSKSQDVYRISVESKAGLSKKFIITENWYFASHSFILWDNDNYIFVRYGCGTNCHGGLILSLNDNRGMLDYQGFIFEDSLRNLIAYPDSIDLHRIIIENFESQKELSLELDFCDESAIPMQMIDTVYIENQDLAISYKAVNCIENKTVRINIDKIKN